MMKRILIIILSFSMYSCKEGYNIERLNRKRLSFDELPSLIQQGYLNYQGTYKIGEAPPKDVITFNEGINYETEGISTFGPASWIDYILIYENGVGKYRIPRRVSRDPYAIMDNYLYMPTEYNMIPYKAKEATYIRFDLRGTGNLLNW